MKMNSRLFLFKTSKIEIVDERKTIKKFLVRMPVDLPICFEKSLFKRLGKYATGEFENIF
jgi:hypothetical protein